MSNVCNSCRNAPFERSKLIPGAHELEQPRAILRSNILPSEPSRFRSIVDEAAREITRYNDEIHRLEHTLARLAADRDALELYRNGYQSIFSPIRRLPRELLAEIFHHTSPAWYFNISIAVTPAEEVERLAKKHLLDISQVCQSWYLGYGPALQSIPASGTILQNPLNRSLRSLRLAFTGGQITLFLCELTLTRTPQLSWTSSSRSFRMLTGGRTSFCVSTLTLSPFFSAVKGNIPLLEKLHISIYSEIGADPPAEFDVFAHAPHLEDVTLVAWFGMLPSLPWGQLSHCLYQNGESEHLAAGINILPLLPPHAIYELKVNLSALSLPPALPPVTSDVSSFIISFMAGSNTLGQTIFGNILDCLTLPGLRHLSFLPTTRTPTPWYQPAFPPFAARSSLHLNLISLEICAVIDDRELLHCLALLPGLEQLFLWDCTEDETITDDLMHGLTWRDDPTNLLPRLHLVGFTSLLRFSGGSCMAFVSSRIGPGRSDKGPFGMQIFRLDSSDCELSAEFIVQMGDFNARGEVAFVQGPGGRKKTMRSI
ncbi:hypothetical protein C8R43DRAFT_1230509 [Mycena crocata]|nr:hypothetical protein C8R43DRAFT_1230509 [Mycena crocata]